MRRSPAMPAVALLAVAALVLAAGCAAPASDGPAIQAALDLGPATPLPPDAREAAASVLFREEVDPAAVDLDSVTGDTAWPPREVALTYHGVQASYDEFARPVPSFVFRYPHMVFVPDELSFDGGVPTIQGHYEPHDFEFAFEEADGRLGSISDVTDGLRAWRGPGDRSALGSLPVVAVAWKVFEEGGRREMAAASQSGHTLLVNFTPAPDDRPLPGDCDPHRITMRWDPPWPGGPLEGLPEVDTEDYRSLVCVEPGEDVPLWGFQGTNESSYRLQRIGPSLELPEFRGEPLPPVAYERAPWQELHGPLPVPVPGPLMLPPGSDGGLWAGEVSERAAALYFSPGYVKYRTGSETPYPTVAFLNTDAALIEILGIRIPPPVLGLRSSLFWLTDGPKTHLHWVYTRHGGAERPDVHVADPNGYDFEAALGGGLPASELPPLVPDGALQGRLSPLLPETMDVLAFTFFSFDLDEDGYEPDEKVAGWVPIQSCTARADGWAAAVDAVSGALQLVMRQRASPDCPEEQPPVGSLLSRPLAAQPTVGQPAMPGAIDPLLGRLSSTAT